MSMRMSDPADAAIAPDPYVLSYGQRVVRQRRTVMQWITVAPPPFNSIDQFDATLAEAGGNPDGLEARYVGSADGRLRVVSLWESKADADRVFTEALPPGLAQ